MITIETSNGILTKRKISGGPVWDSSGMFVGIIFEVDAFREIIKGKYSNTQKFPRKR